MNQVPDDRRPPLTPQLALRVAIIGGVALTMFAIIFFRLWYLQVLTGQQYAHAASLNGLRTVDVPAPRGEILDRRGTVLVNSIRTLDVQIAPGDLPVPIGSANLLTSPAKDARVYRRLAHVLRLSDKRHKCPVVQYDNGNAYTIRAHLARIPCAVAQQVAVLPYANVTIKQDVSKYVQFYLAERQDQFQGVNVEQVYRRQYPLGGLAAQLFGTVGPITPTEVKERQFRGVSRQAIIGQSGLEAQYDPYLRGVDGSQKIEVNSLGQFQRDLGETAPVAGNNLELSLTRSCSGSASRRSRSRSPPIRRPTAAPS
jgi:penicillin-binding protein 2